MNALIKAIAVLLDGKYGYEVYTDEIKQGFSSPCFFIEVTASRRSWINKYRYKAQVFLSLYFYPNEGKGPNSQMLSMADELYGLLDVFECEGRKYRSVDMSHRQTGDYLVFSFNVNCHMKIDDDMPYMEELEHEAFTRVGGNIYGTRKRASRDKNN